MSYGKQATGYQTIPPVGSPTETEAWALIECARRLSESANAEEPRKAMKAALRLNWRLWTIFQAELSDEACKLREDVRLSMLTLCQFVDKHTVSTMLDPVPAKLKVLVDMNRNIAGGLLAGKAAAATTEAAALQASAPPAGAVPTSINLVG